MHGWSCCSRDRNAVAPVFKLFANSLWQVVRKGTDITLVGWGAQMGVLEEACADAGKVLQTLVWTMQAYSFSLFRRCAHRGQHADAGKSLWLQEGISCELIDLRTLIPWDRETVEASVNKTGRLLVSNDGFNWAIW